MSIADFLFGENETERAANMNKQLQEAYKQRESAKGTSDYDSYAQNFNDLYKTAQSEKKANEYNQFGTGLVGNLLNPIYQTATAAGDLATSGTKKWESGERDLASDLGAGAETALTFIPGAGTAKSTLKGAQTLGKTLAKNAALGAGFGAASTVREQGSNTNLSDVLANAGVNAALGGAIGGAASGGSKLWNKLSTGADTTGTLAGKLSNAGTNIKSWATNNGQTGAIKGLLGKTPTKLALTAGGVYGLNKALSGRDNSNTTTSSTDTSNSANGGLTDEELAELYNYYYGGY